MSAIDPKDIDIRVIDQCIGAGIGGANTVIRIYHKPSGLLVEVPNITGSQFHDREVALEMIETALTHRRYQGDPR